VCVCVRTWVCVRVCVCHFHQVMNAFRLGNLSSPTGVLQLHLFPQGVWYIQISSQPNFRLAYIVFCVCFNMTGIIFIKQWMHLAHGICLIMLLYFNENICFFNIFVIFRFLLIQFMMATLHKFQMGLHCGKHKVCLFKLGIIGFYGFFHYNTFNYITKWLMKSNGSSCGTTLATMSFVDCMSFKFYLLSSHNISYKNCKLWCIPKIFFQEYRTKMLINQC
jgi:hypothetical protein